MSACIPGFDGRGELFDKAKIRYSRQICKAVASVRRYVMEWKFRCHFFSGAAFAISEEAKLRAKLGISLYNPAAPVRR